MQNIVTETQTLLKYEIMDGAPVKGELIPVRLYLRGIPADVTPTYHAENNRFAVRYFLNLVLVDEEDRRYFNQQEIILWRKELGWNGVFACVLVKGGTGQEQMCVDKKQGDAALFCFLMYESSGVVM